MERRSRHVAVQPRPVGVHRQQRPTPRRGAHHRRQYGEPAHRHGPAGREQRALAPHCGHLRARRGDALRRRRARRLRDRHRHPAHVAGRLAHRRRQWDRLAGHDVRVALLRGADRRGRGVRPRAERRAGGAPLRAGFQPSDAGRPAHGHRHRRRGPVEPDGGRLAVHRPRGRGPHLRVGVRRRPERHRGHGHAHVRRGRPARRDAHRHRPGGQLRVDDDAGHGDGADAYADAHSHAE